MKRIQMLISMKKVVLLVFVSVLLSTAVVVGFVRPAVAQETIYIRADGSVEGTDKIQRDGDVYTFTDNIYDEIVVERSNIIIDGKGYTLEGAGSGNGFSLSNVSNVTIKNTNVKYFYYGILLDGSSNYNSISGNNIANNGFRGIEHSTSNYNSITANSITANNEHGILLDDSSNYNSISGNNIANNGAGIELYSYSSNNKFYHNNLNNTNQVYSEYSVNVWDDDYPSGGNYWSDYTGMDANGDGIGDTPYVIDADNQDRYPLMYPWSPLPVHNINTGSGYATIQEAIDASETLDGHTIFVEAGTYYEHVTIDKSISLIGEDPATTIIDGGGIESVVEIKANNVTVQNLTIRNGGQIDWWGNAGIRIENWNNTIIQNNIITNNCEGVLLLRSSSNVISGNQITASSQRGLHLWFSSNNIISGNTITNTLGGVDLEGSSNNVISGNNITNNEDGISCVKSSNNTFSGNIITNTWSMHAFVLSVSSYNNISGNTITNNSEWGVALYSSSYNDISQNFIATTKYDGIYLAQLSNNNSIYRNNIRNNDQAGVTLASSSYNMIFENNITNNRYGIRFVKLTETYSNSSKFYHNNFIHNTKQVYAFFQDEYSINVWDDGYPSGGNYWSDYAGVDVKSGPYQNVTGSDGIGDTPHEIDTNNQDRYPLIVPVVWNYSNPIPVVWQGATYSVALSSNSTILTFKFNQTQMQISFDVTGPSGTIGFCNVTIPKSLLKDSPWTVTINGQPPIDFITTDNVTHTFLYFTYTHASTSHVIIQGTEVIPEFPTWTSMLLILIVLTTAITIYKRRLLKTPIH